MRRCSFRATALVFTLFVASCGGRTILLTGTEGTSPGSATGDASSDGDSGCPSTNELLSLGSLCGFTGTCSVSLSCGGVGLATSAVCTDGHIALAPDIQAFCVDIMGDDSGGPKLSCRSPEQIAPETPCEGDLTCTGLACGGQVEIPCTCTDGLWVCQGTSCANPPPPPEDAGADAQDATLVDAPIEDASDDADPPIPACPDPNSSEVQGTACTGDGNCSTGNECDKLTFCGCSEGHWYCANGPEC